MTKPNSLTTKVRRFLARRLDPRPDGGEAWCINCALSNRKTVVLSVDGIKQHAEKHAPTDHVWFECTWMGSNNEPC